MDANVNFAASKLTLYGKATIAELEKAGAFENLRIIPDKEKFTEAKEPFLKKHATVLISAIFLLIGWLLGEGHVMSTIAFGASIIIGGYRLFQIGIKNLFRFTFDMKTLMTIAVIGAAIIGEWGEGATVVILFAISEALERYSMDKARQSIRSLMEIAPKEALIRRDEKEMLVEVEDIAIGDIMIVKPGQKIAMDGVVINGTSAVNQAAITGESVPVMKASADEVFAGTLNEEGLLEVKVTKRVDDSTIAKIIHLVEEAQAERAPSQAFVDRFAQYYTPIIMLVAFGVAIIPPLLGGEWSTWIYQGLAVLVVGCPCALVVSTPVSIVTAIGNAARNGVLIKGGIHLEEMGAIKAMAFDKTGTLTRGVPVVTDFFPLQQDMDRAQLLKIIAALEKRSQHPLASAILKKTEEEKLDYESVEVNEFSSITGKGVKGLIAGETYFVGSPQLLDETLSNGLAQEIKEKINALQTQGKTVIVAGSRTEALAVLAVADEVRENSRCVVEKLHFLGLKKTIMLTGDNKGTAQAIGQYAGVSEIKAELLPQDKLAFIKELQRKYERVAMVGDGINDAPALAAANVGIAMGGAGTDTALETADVALMADDLGKLPFTVKLSRKTLQIIKQNITFSLGIKLIALLLVIPGWLTLWIAIFADMGATLLVTLNSLRLLLVKDQK